MGPELEAAFEPPHLPAKMPCIRRQSSLGANPAQASHQLRTTPPCIAPTAPACGRPWMPGISCNRDVVFSPVTRLMKDAGDGVPQADMHQGFRNELKLDALPLKLEAVIHFLHVMKAFVESANTFVQRPLHAETAAASVQTNTADTRFVAHQQSVRGRALAEPRRHSASGRQSGSPRNRA